MEKNLAAISVEKRADSVAILRFNTPESPVNLLSPSILREFDEAWDTISKDPEIRACVIASAKEDSFIAGADLKVLSTIKNAREAEDFSKKGHALLDRVELSDKPVVAAIHGIALGGGLEVALACHARVCTDDPKTVLGLPEVTLGVLPGGGGTQRLPRLVGLRSAIPMLLTGKRIRSKKALKMGLVDRVTSPAKLIDQASKLAVQLADRKQKGGKQKKAEKRLDPDRLLLKAAGLPVVGRVIFKEVEKGVRKKTRGLYPAPLAIVKCVEAGLREDRDAGYAIEAKEFGRLVAGNEAKNLIGLFQAMTALKSPSTNFIEKAGIDTSTRSRLWVLGGGLMGEGVASVSIPFCDVVVRDLQAETLKRVEKNIGESLRKRVQAGSLAPADERVQHQRLKTTRELETLKNQVAEGQAPELVIEAVFENLELKRKILREIEEIVPETTVFASNTSALSISEIATDARHPERVLGMHYFSPVPKMPLLEIVVTPKTADWALARAQAYGASQGKSMIVVKDSPGFYTTRILAPFLNEAVLLLEEGANILAIDGAIKDFGFPVGPIALIDEVGIDVGAHVSKDLGRAFAARDLNTSDLLNHLHDAGFGGRKNRKGFYLYPESKKSAWPGLVVSLLNKKPKKEANPEVYEKLAQLRPGWVLKSSDHSSKSSGKLAERIVWMMINEAMLCLQEGVIRSARDGDVGAILGLGFAPFRGGPFKYVDSLGLDQALATMRKLEKAHGPRFRPAPILVEMAKTGGAFYADEKQGGRS